MKRKISGDDYSGYILPLGLLVGGYFVAKNFGLFGSAANDSNNAAIDQTTTAGINAALGQDKSVQTMSDAVIAGMASSLFALYDTDDPSQIRQIVIQCNTTKDILKLAQAFGTKEISDSSFSTCAFFGFDCQKVNLSGYLRAVLPQSEINIINNYFSGTGINYAI
jgi:hypothetical protein